jgi:hypothetical protein
MQPLSSPPCLNYCVRGDCCGRARAVARSVRLGLSQGLGKVLGIRLGWFFGGYLVFQGFVWPGSCCTTSLLHKIDATDACCELVD